MEIDNLMSDAVRMLANLKKEKKEIEDEMAARLAPVLIKIEQLTDGIAVQMTKLGADSIKTPYGTPYFHNSAVVRCGDWDSFYKFVQQTGRLDFLQRRPHETNIKTYIEEIGNQAAVPGVIVTNERSLRLRSNNSTET
jgi:hypothetical protein